MKPTHAQIKAVQNVLYDHNQLKQAAQDVQQVNLLMNLSGPPLPANDVRGAVGNGPEWLIQATGQLDPSVAQAVARCRSIAARLQSMRSALGRLDLPSADKQFLMTALKEQALTWSTRATLWEETTAPSDPTGAVAKITAHQTAAFAALGHVQAYLRPIDSFHLPGT